MSGLKIGDVDIGNQVLDNEFRIKLLFKVLQNIMKKNKLTGPLKAEVDEMTKDIERELQDKYPNSDVKLS